MRQRDWESEHFSSYFHLHLALIRLFFDSKIKHLSFLQLTESGRMLTVNMSHITDLSHLALAIVVLIAIIALPTRYHDTRFQSERQLEIFKVCIGTVQPDVLRSADALRANIELCKIISDSK